MTFKVGDWVLAPTMGIGRIDGRGPHLKSGYEVDGYTISFPDPSLSLHVRGVTEYFAPTKRAHELIFALPQEDYFLEALEVAAGATKKQGGRWNNQAQAFEQRFTTGDLKEIAKIYRDCKANKVGNELDDGVSYSKGKLKERAFDILIICYSKIAQVSKAEATETVQQLIDNPALNIRKSATQAFTPAAKEPEEFVKPTSYSHRGRGRKAPQVSMQIDEGKIDMADAYTQRRYETAKEFYADQYNKFVLFVIEDLYRPQYRADALKQYELERGIAPASFKAEKSSVRAHFNKYAEHKDTTPAPAHPDAIPSGQGIPSPS